LYGFISANVSLDKPWNERPEAAKAYENLSADTVQGDALPKALLDLVADSPEQRGLQDYDEVHTWWWVAYEAMLAELKLEGEAGGWKEIDASVKR
jgi:hypothetical protein